MQRLIINWILNYLYHKSNYNNANSNSLNIHIIKINYNNIILKSYYKISVTV